MQFIKPFRQFHPINGELDGPFPLIVFDIVERARKLIKGRTTDEINYAVNTINYLIHKADVDRAGLSGILKQDSNDNEIKEIKFNQFIDEFSKLQDNERLFSPARSLLEQINNSDISDQDSFPKAKFEEYFAILALAAIGEMYWIYKEDPESTIGTDWLAVEAMEALTIAEAPKLVIPVHDKSLANKISLRNSKNAILQHAAVNAWKPKFHTWVKDDYLPNLSDEEPTKRGAARAYKRQVLDKLIKEGRAPELEDQIDLVRTLANSLPKTFPEM